VQNGPSREQGTTDTHCIVTSQHTVLHSVLLFAAGNGVPFAGPIVQVRRSLALLVPGPGLRPRSYELGLSSVPALTDLHFAANVAGPDEESSRAWRPI